MNELHVACAVYVRTWRKVIRRPVVLLLSFAQPLIWMTFFGFLFHRFPLTQLPGQVSYIDFLTVLLGASQSGIGLIRDMQTAMLERIMATPAGGAGLLAGKVAADVSRLLLQAVIVVLVGLMLGVRCQLAAGPLLMAFVYLATFGAGYCALSCWIALQTRSQETMASFVHLANMPIFFTSTALVPVKQMPAWLESIAVWNPLTLVVEPLREALLFGTATQSHQALPVLLIAAGVLFALAARVRVLS
jgi:ABC-2 type transport system permease protein